MKYTFKNLNDVLKVSRVMEDKEGLSYTDEDILEAIEEAEGLTIIIDSEGAEYIDQILER